MSEPAEKAWYQDGWLMLSLAGVAAFVYFAWFTPKQEFVDIQLNGRVTQGLFGDETLKITCWHIFPGTLEKGRITVTAEGSALAKDYVVKYRSFDEWPPNEEHHMTVEFPLQEVERDSPIRLSIVIVAQNAKDSRYETEWTGDQWSAPLINKNLR